MLSRSRLSHATLPLLKRTRHYGQGKALKPLAKQLGFCTQARTLDFLSASVRRQQKTMQSPPFRPLVSAACKQLRPLPAMRRLHCNGALSRSISLAHPTTSSSQCEPRNARRRCMSTASGGEKKASRFIREGACTGMWLRWERCAWACNTLAW